MRLKETRKERKDMWIGRHIPQMAVAGAAVLLTAGCSASANVPLFGRVSLNSGPAAGVLPAQPSASATGTTVTPDLINLQSQYVQVVQRVSPSVVQIETGQGLGSGIVFDQQGDIVTNAHVVAQSDTFVVTTSSGKHYDGRLVGVATQNDLAVIRTSAGDLQPAQFADSSQLKVGSIVLAVGNPLGLQGSVTEGIVSSLNRQISESRRVTLKGLIQTSASINPGNSGGALVDLQGRVEGIPTLGAVDPQMGGSAPGIGFAIPSNQVVSTARQLIASK